MGLQLARSAGGVRCLPGAGDGGHLFDAGSLLRLASLLVLEPATLTVVFSYSPSISEAIGSGYHWRAGTLRRWAACVVPHYRLLRL